MNNILEMLKVDLGITHSKRDAYFNDLIKTSIKELELKGIKIDDTKVEDQMLVSDYSAWVYRKRQEDIPLSMNLTQRIRNRIVKGRAEKND